jgi:ribosomal-protein-alanine N-acetyltransferase
MLSLNFSPFPQIETERLLLRKLTMDDVSQLYFLRTNKEVTEYLNKAIDASIEATRLKIEEILELQEKNEAVFWVITKKENPGVMIGNIGYWRMVKEHFRAEVGYLLHPAHWQKGIMKEALNAVLEYAFTKTNLHSIEANINPGNMASAALLESCGFVKEAYHKENYFYDGVFYDSIIYSRLDNKK